MRSLAKGSYVVQGINIYILCDYDLQFLLSSYFNSLYRGKKRLDISPLELELIIVDKPPSLPVGSVPVVKSPSIVSYRNGYKIYFASKYGSIISLDPAARMAKAFLQEELLKDGMELFSFICAPIVETLKYHGLYPLHSAALYGNGRGYLISGNSGCGKTTISLSLVSQGFKYVSDDFLLYHEEDEEIFVHSLYRSFNVDNNLTDFFPEVATGVKQHMSKDYKAYIEISQVFHGSFVPFTKPDVIILPRITPVTKSWISPLNRKETYSRLLKQITLAAENEIAKKQLATLEKLVKQTIGFELFSGRDVFENREELSYLLTQVNRLG